MAQAPPHDLRPATPQARNVSWQEGNLDRRARWKRLRQRGTTIWFTGLSGSGKSTVACAVEEELIAARRWAYRLDGDNLRHGVCSDLGFSRDDRAENARRVAELALLFADAGSVALVCLVSPYAVDRRHARELHEQAGLDFIEVFVNTSLEECARRDVKGLYAQARGGTLANLTGVGAPYEIPGAPDVELTEDLDVPAAAARVLAALPAVSA
ncbi:MAG TPA: adenylyl-sulfate kinase [Solirubrobacteraceae bacterium]|nr:adenylyl-sulfate kinase [Solirubrobacteraceae bacterium]